MHSHRHSLSHTPSQKSPPNPHTHTQTHTPCPPSTPLKVSHTKQNKTQHIHNTHHPTHRHTHLHATRRYTLTKQRRLFPALRHNTTHALRPTDHRGLRLWLRRGVLHLGQNHRKRSQHRLAHGRDRHRVGGLQWDAEGQGRRERSAGCQGHRKRSLGRGGGLRAHRRHSSRRRRLQRPLRRDRWCWRGECDYLDRDWGSCRAWG